MGAETKRTAGKFQTEQFSVGTFLHDCFRTKVDKRKFFLIFFEFRQNRPISRKFNQKSVTSYLCNLATSKTILYIEYFISSLLYELPHEFLSDLRLRILRNYEMKR